MRSAHWSPAEFADFGIITAQTVASFYRVRAVADATKCKFKLRIFLSAASFDNGVRELFTFASTIQLEIHTFETKFECEIIWIGGNRILFVKSSFLITAATSWNEVSSSYADIAFMNSDRADLSNRKG